MNLYFRLIFFILRAFFVKKDASILDEIKTPMRVFPNDLDFNMHMNNGRYLTVMDLGRFDYIAHTKILKLCVKHRWTPILGAAQIIYKKPLKLWQKYHIVTKLEYWDTKWFVMTQRFEVNGKVMAIAMVKGLFRGKHGNVKPIDILSRLDAADKKLTSPVPPVEITNWLKSLE